MHFCIISDFLLQQVERTRKTNFSSEFTFQGECSGLDGDQKEGDILDHSTNPAALNAYALKEDTRVHLL